MNCVFLSYYFFLFLGGIFPQEVPISAEEKAFSFAVEKVNEENEDNNDTRLQLDVRLVQANATFEATRTGKFVFCFVLSYFGLVLF